MKKLYSLLAVTLLAVAVWANVSLPHATAGFDNDIASTETADGWSKKKNDRYGTVWSKNSNAGFISGTGVNSVARLFDNNVCTDRDVMLISPKFDATAGKTYKVSVMYKCLSTPTVTCHVLLGNPWAADFDAAACPSVEFVNLDSSTGDKSMTSYETKEMELTATATGATSVVFRVSGTYKGQLLIAKVDIEEKAEAAPVDPTPDPDPVTPPAEDHSCSGKSLPYSSPIATSSSTSDPEWIIINANNDAKTWAAASDSKMGACMKYIYDRNNNADDYLVSPLVHLDATGEYIVNFNVRANTALYPENFKVILAEDKSADALKNGTVIKDFPSYNKIAVTKETVKFTPVKTGDYYVAIHCYSIANQYSLYVNDFKLFENVFAPAEVSGFTAVAAARPEMKVSLKWTLPTTSLAGDALTPEQAIQKVLIYRDGGETPIAELAGTATSFDDTDATGLTSGEHTYSIKVQAAGAYSALVTSAKTAYVGPIAPTAVPATFEPITQDAFDLFTVVRGPKSGASRGWEYYAYSKSAYLTVGSSKVEDDWLIAPPVAVSEPGYYRVTFTSKIYDASEAANLTAYMCKSGLVADMKPVASNFPFTGSYQDFTFDFHADAAGTYYVGFYVQGPARDYTQQYFINKVKVEKGAETPAAVSNLQVATNDENNEAVLTWTNPTKNTAGMDLSSGYSLEVYVDGIKQADSYLAGTTTATVTTSKIGSHAFMVKTVGAAGTSAAEHPTVKAWTGPKVVEAPYSVNFQNTADETAVLWTAYDLNNDGLGWALDGGYTLTEGTEEFVTYNDYLVSPSMNLQPGYYKVTAYVKGGYTPWSGTGKESIFYKVGVSAGRDFATNPVAIEQVQKCSSSESNYWEVTYAFKVTTAGEYHVVYFVDELNPKMSAASLRLNIRDVKVAKTPLLPTVAQQFTAIPDPDQKLEVTLKWTNPTESSIDGVSLAAGDITKAVIFRNGEELATVTNSLTPGEVTEYIDNTLTAAGYHTYSVELYTADGKHTAAAPSVKTAWVGGALNAPYTAEGEEFKNWTIDNVDKDFNSWGGEVTWNASVYGASMTCTSKLPNDWIVSNPINFEHNYIYKVELQAYCNLGFTDGFKYDLYAGTAADHKALTLVGTHDVPGTATKNAPHSCVFYIWSMPKDEVPPEFLKNPWELDLRPEATRVDVGGNRLALYAGKSKLDGGVKSLAVTRLDHATGIDAVAATMGIFFDGNVLHFPGAAAIEVYNTAGALVNMAQASDEYSLGKLATGVYMVKVACENGSNATVKFVKR